MKSMTLMPMAVMTAAAARPRTAASYVHVPEVFGAAPTTATGMHRVCTWSSMTNGNVIRQAKGLKAFGTRRLGESST